MGHCRRRQPRRRGRPEGDRGTGRGRPRLVLRGGASLYFNSVALVEDGAVQGIYRKAHIPDGPGLRGEVLLQPGGHRLPDLADPSWAHRRGHLLGPVVSRGRPDHGPAGGRPPPLPDRHRQRGREPGRQRHRRHVAAGHGWATRSATMCRWPRPTGSGPRTNSPSTGRPSSSTTVAGRWPQAGRTTEETIYAELDFSRAEADRAGWGLFRDRRPDLYGGISTTPS